MWITINCTEVHSKKEITMSQMRPFPPAPTDIGFGQASVLQTNKVLRNTYLLLSLTLVAGALGAYVAAATNMPVINKWLYLAFALGMPFVIHATKDSALGLVSCFVYTTGLGIIAGPIISMYAKFIGPQVPIYAFGATATVFGALTIYALSTRKDFSFMRGFLMAGSIAVVLAIVANIFLQMSIFSLIISSVVVVLSSAGILYSTSAAINGGEDNYIVLASTIYADLWAMFMSLMHIFGFASSDN
jgi:modulator of FtsH protease